jgi:hypothetical protein
MEDFRRQNLAAFVAWAGKHITGDEKGEAQVFLDRLFQAFGQGGIREAGATLEMRVRQADNKGTAFADLVWKPIVLIEMKRRGQDLSRHYRQAFDYWTRLVPGRPRYARLFQVASLQAIPIMRSGQPDADADEQDRLVPGLGVNSADMENDH